MNASIGDFKAPLPAEACGQMAAFFFSFLFCYESRRIIKTNGIFFAWADLSRRDGGRVSARNEDYAFQKPAFVISTPSPSYPPALNEAWMVTQHDVQSNYD